MAGFICNHDLDKDARRKIESLAVFFQYFGRCSTCKQARHCLVKKCCFCCKQSVRVNEVACLSCAQAFCTTHYQEHFIQSAECMQAPLKLVFERNQRQCQCNGCSEYFTEKYPEMTRVGAKEIQQKFLRDPLISQLPLSQMQGRLCGNSIRAQALALGHTITRHLDQEDEYCSYDLLAFTGMDSTGPALEFLPIREGESKGLGIRLETLRQPKQYQMVVGVHFVDGNEVNFENTLRGIIQSCCMGTPLEDQKQRALAVIFIDNVDILAASNLPLPQLLKRLNLYDEKIKDEFFKVANQICDKIECDNSEKPSSALDLALAFESTVKYNNHELVAEFAEPGSPDSLDVLLVLKHQSKGLLHSQLWLMTGFAEHLQPTYLLAMDIDVEPTAGSLNHMVEAFDNPSVVAVCGELEARTQLNIVSLSQWFEYKMSYVMSKRIENLYGHVSSLSPAFSLFKWSALREVLFTYFQPFTAPNKLGWTLSNLYSVAPERVLSSYLFNARPDNRVIYVESAKALVTPLVSFQQFLKSRWHLVSGQWFYMLCCMRNSLGKRKSLGCGYSLIYYFFRYYFYLAIMVSYVSVSGLYLALSIVSRQVFEDAVENEQYTAYTSILQIVYILVFVISLLISISRSAERLISYWKLAMLIYGLLSVFFFCDSAYLIYVAEKVTTKMIIGMLGFFMLWISPVLSSSNWISCELLKNTVAAVCYLLMIPSYINILTAISITKADNDLFISALPNSSASKLDKFGLYRTAFINVFVILNVLLGGILDHYDRKGYIWVPYVLLLASLGFLAIPVLLLVLKRVGTVCCQFGGCVCRGFNRVVNPNAHD